MEYADFLKGWTPGGVGIWTLVIMALVAWWKGLPAFIDAMANRQSKIEERMGALLQQTTDRFSRELADADKRHEDCVKSQEVLRARIEAQDKKIAEQQECISEQQATIEGLKRQMLQMQQSAIRLEGMGSGGIAEVAKAAVKAFDVPTLRKVD